MAKMKSLACRECGKEYPTKDIHVCELCFGPLEVKYDYEEIKASISREKIQTGPKSLWRYIDLLPVEGQPTVGKYAGFTPLVRAHNLGAFLGIDELYIKNDCVNHPTLSFKDRVVAIALTRARELGFETVLTAYGLTETCGVVSICREEDGAELIATTSGRAMPGVEVRCVGGDGNELPRGEPGEVVVRGFNVMLGYFDSPEETAKAIDADGWLHTGDVAIMDEQGYIRITDRIKDMFITGGFNCYPAEIENGLSELHSIAQAAVIGVADERMGEVAKAFIVLTDESTLTAEEIIAWCRENMANYKVPRHIEFLDEMPLNAAGKVLKNELRSRHNAQ